MWRFVGISLGLVGMTVAGGMGLSLVHDTVFANPTQVRAQVIRPAAVLRRATAIRPDAVVALTERPQAVRVARAPSNADALRTSITGVATDATVLPLRGTVEPIDAGVDGNQFPSPVVSLRPKLRGQAPVQTARLTPAVARRTTISSPVRAEVQRAAPVPVYIPQPQRVQTGSRTLAPRVLIGVYR